MLKPVNSKQKNSSKNRIPGLDVVRVFASLGVIWTHLAKDILIKEERNYHLYGQFAVPFFIFIAILFFLAPLMPRKISRYLLLCQSEQIEFYDHGFYGR